MRGEGGPRVCWKRFDGEREHVTVPRCAEDACKMQVHHGYPKFESFLSRGISGGGLICCVGTLDRRVSVGG